LIDISLEDNQLDELHELLTNLRDEETKRLPDRIYRGEEIAKTLEKIFPSASIEIWKGIAGFQAGRAVPGGYYNASCALSEIKTLMPGEEWNAFITEVKEKNQRRPRYLKEIRKFGL